MLAHARTRSKRITTHPINPYMGNPYFNKGIYRCLFIASASFCSPAYIIPPAIHAPTIIAKPVNKVATSIVISSPPSSYVIQRIMHYSQPMQRKDGFLHLPDTFSYLLQDGWILSFYVFVEKFFVQLHFRCDPGHGDKH